MENMAETTLTRRSFVKASALVGATAAFGASMAGCMQEAPQEQAPSGGGADEGLVRMKTSCHGCIQMCPAIAYLKDGVVVKLEGDPDAPVSRGSLCIKGLNQLHTMYSPAACCIRFGVPASAARTNGRSSAGTRPSRKRPRISATPSTNTAPIPSSPAWAAAGPTRSWRP